MIYSLFLDDERMPPEKKQKGKWLIVRNFDDAKSAVLKRGFPSFISFDHDLGTGATGYDFAKWLVEYDMDTNTMPEDFEFYVHSQNPIGAANIRNYLNSYIKIKKI